MRMCFASPCVLATCDLVNTDPLALNAWPTKLCELDAAVLVKRSTNRGIRTTYRNRGVPPQFRVVGT
jgi:hypothetical protein